MVRVGVEPTSFASSERRADQLHQRTGSCSCKDGLRTLVGVGFQLQNYKLCYKKKIMNLLLHILIIAQRHLVNDNRHEM